MDAMDHVTAHNEPIYKHAPLYLTPGHDHEPDLLDDTAYECIFVKLKITLVIRYIWRIKIRISIIILSTDL